MMDCALVLAGTIHLPVICVTKTAGRIFSLSAGSSLELVYAAEHAPSPPQQQDALSDDESETTMSREPPQRIFATCSTDPCLGVPPGPDGSSVSSGSSDSFDGTSTGYGTSTAQSTGVSTSRRGGSSDDSTDLTTARSSTTGGASGLPL